MPASFCFALRFQSDAEHIKKYLGGHENDWRK